MRFEDLVGPKGGGTTATRTHTIKRVQEFLGVNHAPDEREADIYNESAFSFRRGQIGAWRDELQPDTQELLQGSLAAELHTYGYDTYGYDHLEAP